jgi:hypothetical protein
MGIVKSISGGGHDFGVMRKPESGQNPYFGGNYGGNGFGDGRREEWDPYFDKHEIAEMIEEISSRLTFF